MTNVTRRSSCLDRRAAPALFAGLGLLLSAGCSQTFRNPGDAMAPAIKDGDRVTITRAVEPLRRGDVVVFRYPNDQTKNFVKRVVGLPGETLAIVDGGVVVNGRPLDEPYVSQENRSRDSFGPQVVPPGQYFLMGDNRRNSSDSRHWGAVPVGLIWGKAVLPPAGAGR